MKQNCKTALAGGGVFTNIICFTLKKGREITSMGLRATMSFFTHFDRNSTLVASGSERRGTL